MYTTEVMVQDTENCMTSVISAKACRNSPEMTRKMVDVFIKTIPLQWMKSNSCTGAVIMAEKTAHRIKPVILMYAIVKAEKVVLDIEMMAKERDQYRLPGPADRTTGSHHPQRGECTEKEFNTW